MQLPRNKKPTLGKLANVQSLLQVQCKKLRSLWITLLGSMRIAREYAHLVLGQLFPTAIWPNKVLKILIYMEMRKVTLHMEFAS